jgi:hypothetical protein
MLIRSTHKPDGTPRAPGEKSPMVCQALGCSAAIPRNYLMCPRHWSEVPPEMQLAVISALSDWQLGKTNLYPYQAARLTAIIAVGKLHSEILTVPEAKLAAITAKLLEESNGC